MTEPFLRLLPRPLLAATIVVGAGAALAPSAARAQVTLDIVNAGFETGSFSPWIGVGIPPDGNAQVNMTAAHVGTYGAFLEEAGNGTQDDQSGFAQNISTPIAFGQRVIFRFDYFIPTTDPLLGNMELQARFRFRDRGVPVGGFIDVVIEQFPVPAGRLGTWVRAQAVEPVPTGVDSVQLWVRLFSVMGTGFGTTYIDETEAIAVTSPYCGDGPDYVEGTEDCDEGLANSDEPNATCRTDCTDARCGDMIIDDGAPRMEECDLGAMNADTPNAMCRLDCTDARCGDGVTDDGAPRREECDDADSNADAPNACRLDCSLPACGDDIVDDAAPYNEMCDRGGLNADTPNAPCREDCQDPICGDGITDDGAPRNEACDDGGANSDTTPNACRLDCSLPFCGDEVVDDEAPFDEACDQGAMNSDTAPNTCRGDCTEPSCGDGVRDDEAPYNEECDEGDDNMDGVPGACNTSCEIEPGGPDMGPQPDMGPRPDMGPPPDLGPPVDAGPQPDLGPMPMGDAGPLQRNIGGSGIDCAVSPGAPRSGAGGTLAVLALLAFLGLRRRRARRAAAS
ncbi:MAG: hypothetical protein ACFCGT_21630 [Sandaracinaceae bacterium]